MNVAKAVHRDFVIVVLCLWSWSFSRNTGINDVKKNTGKGQVHKKGCWAAYISFTVLACVCAV